MKAISLLLSVKLPPASSKTTIISLLLLVYIVGWQGFCAFSCECAAIKYTNKCPFLFDSRKAFTTKTPTTFFIFFLKKSYGKLPCPPTQLSAI